MGSALTPQDALAYLRELSADVRAGVVLDAAGPGRPVLAGLEALAGPARALLDALDGPCEAVALPQGVAVAARSQTHAVVLACGPHALRGLHLHDVVTVLDDLTDGDRGTSAGLETLAPTPSGTAREAARAVLDGAEMGAIP